MHIITTEDIKKWIYNLDYIKGECYQRVSDELLDKDYILLEDNRFSLPRKILTTAGVLNIVDDFEVEINKKSKISSCYAFAKKDLYWNIYMLGKRTYKIYYSPLILYLLENPNILLNYLNYKHNLNLTLDDIKAENIINKAEVLKKKIEVNTQRNNSIENGIYKIRYKKDVLVLKENKIYRSVEDGELENIGRFKHRRSCLFNKNETNARSSVSA